ncbi:DUT nucleotidohydrolase, partial [Chionis minor]|nr:DUT nucleotidohydrolase [Chionis minor]
RGSAGVDLAVGKDVTIEDDNVHVIPSMVTGPLGHGLSALLLGRSSASQQGIFVLPGVIDADYTGPIGIMLKVFTPPLILKQGSKIAQLVPFMAQVPHRWEKERGNRAFGSSGSPLAAFVQPISREQPIREVTITGPDGVSINRQKMLLDSGADVTIIP